ncbi:MAG: histidine phosphatase family protein [Candidatus Marinimicrobia bacterium]|nr:histidine phosphatase family protein [Candidatus Neomarinimicrobiota bacterium]
MKKLFIIRHSKASETSPDNSDLNRCLEPYGVDKATRIAEYLASHIETVDLMLTSPACRAFETAQIFARKLKYPEKKIRGQEALYHFGGIENALDIISEVDDNTQVLMLFGHNPTFNVLAWHLCDEFRDAMPTSAVVGLEFNINEWNKIRKAKGKLITYVTKKQIQPF